VAAVDAASSAATTAVYPFTVKDVQEEDLDHWIQYCSEQRIRNRAELVGCVKNKLKRLMKRQGFPLFAGVGATAQIVFDWIDYVHQYAQEARVELQQVINSTLQTLSSILMTALRHSKSNRFAAASPYYSTQ
jgi:hypothetical protein